MTPALAADSAGSTSDGATSTSVPGNITLRQRLTDVAGQLPTTKNFTVPTQFATAHFGCLHNRTVTIATTAGG
ncbi:MAG: hypothetical protein QOJ39_3094 [Candidatus Eremiobacteraeota bacterium]|jgi:hypothetical protein|nr:hypothetical protein [Candidatus Eremiobacteraeota bacterium]